jgi:hypothetical protein
MEEDNTSKPTRHDYITIRVAFMALTCVFLLTLMGFLWLLKETHDLAVDTRTLSEANIQRVRENRNNSIKSCKANIEGVRQIFKPFFPRTPTTLEQKKVIIKFNHRIDELKKNCKKQLSK